MRVKCVWCLKNEKKEEEECFRVRKLFEELWSLSKASSMRGDVYRFMLKI